MSNFEGPVSSETVIKWLNTLPINFYEFYDPFNPVPTFFLNDGNPGLQGLKSILINETPRKVSLTLSIPQYVPVEFRQIILDIHKGMLELFRDDEGFIYQAQYISQNVNLSPKTMKAHSDYRHNHPNSPKIGRKEVPKLDEYHEDGYTPHNAAQLRGIEDEFIMNNKGKRLSEQRLRRLNSDFYEASRVIRDVLSPQMQNLSQITPESIDQKLEDWKNILDSIDEDIDNINYNGEMLDQEINEIMNDSDKEKYRTPDEAKQDIIGLIEYKDSIKQKRA